ncbi:PqqD family peptide modification chaperone [Streptomyces millisiae]|uniref:PqqD family peptide modification chaperone n=1 Tax=Streptomyces millisiae TaxID=3075542 RepID=A0ABU2LXF0_9ACTN|nr:PqqD family peptide modification chaperone [Streptomyces sp. DSM 44918]MDT0321867.1 PqqD family peptide modification chaperone [Streptomyces sp. DSM 44918]
MPRLAPGVKLVTDTGTGRGSLICPDGAVWTLNPSAATALQAAAKGENPLDAMARRWPGVPEDVLRADLTALLADLQAAGVVAEP